MSYAWMNTEGDGYYGIKKSDIHPQGQYEGKRAKNRQGFMGYYISQNLRDCGNYETVRDFLHSDIDSKDLRFTEF